MGAASSINKCQPEAPSPQPPWHPQVDAPPTEPPGQGAQPTYQPPLEAPLTRAQASVTAPLPDFSLILHLHAHPLHSQAAVSNRLPFAPDAELSCISRSQSTDGRLGCWTRHRGDGLLLSGPLSPTLSTAHDSKASPAPGLCPWSSNSQVFSRQTSGLGSDDSSTRFPGPLLVTTACLSPVYVCGQVHTWCVSAQRPNKNTG